MSWKWKQICEWPRTWHVQNVWKLETRDIDWTLKLQPCLLNLLPLHIVGALTGAGGEAVVQRIAEGAHGICPGLAWEAGGGGLVPLAAVLPALPRIGVAVASAAPQARVRIQAAVAGAAVIQLVQGLQREIERARLVCTDGRLFHGNLLTESVSCFAVEGWLFVQQVVLGNPPAVLQMWECIVLIEVHDWQGFLHTASLQGLLVLVDWVTLLSSVDQGPLWWAQSASGSLGFSLSVAAAPRVRAHLQGSFTRHVMVLGFHLPLSFFSFVLCGDVAAWGTKTQPLCPDCIWSC